MKPAIVLTVLLTIVACLCLMRHESRGESFGPGPGPALLGAANAGSTEPKFPWFCSIYGDNDKVAICGGVLVGPDSVMTHSNCLANKKITAIQVGETKYPSKIIKRIHLHRQTGLAIIRLHNKMPNAPLKIAKTLPTKCTFARLIGRGIRSVGGPYDGKLGWGAVRFMPSNDKCLPSTFLENSFVDNPLVLNLYSNPDQRTAVACDGDMGGPVFIPTSYTGFELIGILSSGGCRNKAGQGYYWQGAVNVPALRPWIDVAMSPQANP